jgi:endonuclease G
MSVRRNIPIVLLWSVVAFSCAELKETNSPDDNNDIHHAVLLSAQPSTVSGFITEPADEDYYRIYVIAARSLRINLSVPESKNYALYLLAYDETALDSSTGSIVYNVSQSGNYYLKIISRDGSFASTKPYRLTAYHTDTSGVPGFSSPHLVLGNPSKAAATVDSAKNYLIEKPQYSLSYNSFSGRPNWVSWHLNSAWLGTVTRQEDFRTDTELPATWYHVTNTDFSGTGYDRGHMCPSGDRTATESDNSETFLMTNMIAQAPDNNQGPWAALENYCRELVSEGSELFIISGDYGSSGTIAGGHVSVPSRVWKVIVALDYRDSGLSGVSTNSRVIAVDMPNSNNVGSNWKNYRVPVDQIEASTGYDLLSNIPPSIQSVIESSVDDK